MIEFENVTWQRQGNKILKEINWTVEPQQHWAVLGLNGSGKTSLLNIVNGYSFPTKGRVQVLGTTFGKGSLPKLRESIGFVSSALNKFGTTFNRQTVEGLIISGKFASIGLYDTQAITQEDKDLAHDLARTLGIDHLLKQRYGRLSQGEQRRTLIARALMAQPKLLILDEPCTGLDLLAREQLLKGLDQLEFSNTQLLYVTHYIEEIIPMISHILLLKDGEIVAQGPKKEVLNDANLTETFQVPIQLHWQDKRPWITIQHD